MKNKKQQLNLLGIAKRAGKIVSGENLLLGAIRNHQIGYLFIANDGGASSQKKFMDKSNFYQVPVCNDFSKAEISEAIGIQRTMVGINDAGFAKRFVELTQK